LKQIAGDPISLVATHSVGLQILFEPFVSGAASPVATARKVVVSLISPQAEVH